MANELLKTLTLDGVSQDTSSSGGNMTMDYAGNIILFPKTYE